MKVLKYEIIGTAKEIRNLLNKWINNKKETAEFRLTLISLEEDDNYEDDEYV